MSTTTPMDKPKPRKIVAVLTDAEWRALRVAAIDDGTTLQGLVTNVVLREVQTRMKPQGG